MVKIKRISAFFAAVIIATAALALIPLQVQARGEMEGDISATEAQWIDLFSKTGQKISVRFYNKGESEYADLERNDKTYRLSKVTEEDGNPVFGDGVRLTLVSYGGGSSALITDGKSRVRYSTATEPAPSKKHRLQPAEDEISAEDSPWIEMRSSRGLKISVRYYQKNGGEWADLEMNDKTYALSKVTEQRGNPVYGDGRDLTMVSRSGGGSVEVTQGDTRTVYK
jgi:hypothetical protein